MTTETKGRSSARTVKIISALLLAFGIIGAMAGSGFFAFLLLVGFFGFAVGRFME
jgi:hypothetical protein